MTVVETRISALNPDAPLFDPVAFREVEDFSPKWWELVKTSKWFRDFWLSANPEDQFGGDEYADVEEQFEELVQSSESEGEHEASHAISKLQNDVKLLLRVVVDPPKAKATKNPFPEPKHHHKPAKHVNSKFSPRRVGQINQPR